MRLIPLIALSLAAMPTFASGDVIAGWTSSDLIHSATVLPAEPLLPTDTLTAWRGEKVSAEALLYAADGTAGPLTLSLEGGYARYMDYVLTDDQRSCGQHNFDLTPWPVADIIGLDWERTLEPGKVQPVWASIRVPADAAEGPHDYTLRITDDAGHLVAALPLVVNVQPRTLPEPKEWAFHLDFWQQPYAVSRYYGLERWSPEHFEALKPYMRALADAGQKVVTTILFYEPWGVQSHDKFDPMVQTVRRADGAWQFDFDVFDRYVEMMAECGIDRQINCYSMVPWDMSFRYFDETSQQFQTLDTSTGTDAYDDLWGDFLRSFSAHLRAKGWFDKTCIAMDERGLKLMLDAKALVERTVPDMKMSLAGNLHPELTDYLHDYCIPYGHSFSAEDLAARRERGQVSTVYTCCTEAEPNILSNNNPVDGAYLPLYAVANGFDGYLHWSWINWPDNPLSDSRFMLFSAGDTYLFYPGPRSSARFEKIIEGVQMAEKIRLLRESGADMSAIDSALAASSAQTPLEAVAAIRNAIDSTK